MNAITRLGDPSPIRPEDIGYTLSRVDGGPKFKIGNGSSRARSDIAAGTVQDPEGRLRAHPDGAAWIEDVYGGCDPRHSQGRTDSFKWTDNWHYIPCELLRAIFTLEELLRLWNASVIMSNLSDWVDKEHPFLRKISYAHWHYGCGRDWNLLVQHLEGFKRLRVDLPDFEIRLTHTRTINTAAWSEHLRSLYLDASFGMLLYYKSKHVLTVGFAPSWYGVLVAQVQLREKKGNRFLFKLPNHYLDVALDILRKAFAGPLWLVTGESTTQAIRKAYGAQPCTMTNEDEIRIENLYNRPLDKFDRTTKTYRHEGRVYVRLVGKRSRRKVDAGVPT